MTVAKKAKPAPRGNSTPAYKNPALPVAERVEDLLGRMTVEEKVGQMLQFDGRDPNIVRLVAEKHLGSILCVLDEDTVAAQRAAVATRLGIPLLIGIDAIHGHSMEYGATMFPSGLGMACTWNEELIEKTARVTAVEMQYTGAQWTFNPVFCLPRDLRWGRVNETFGEDPHLIGRFGVAMIRGYQGKNLADHDAVAACAKHFAGYGDTLGGRDASEGEHSRRKMRALFLPVFQQAVAAGVASFMAGYECIDGVPSSACRWLLTDILREEWGYDGMVVTDWDNVGRMVRQKMVSPDLTDASAHALHAGNDLIMQTHGFYDAVLGLLKAGKVKIAAVDQAVRRILALKFKLGLFENPRFADAEKSSQIIGRREHREVALQAARESAVLLKNRGNLLPFKPGRMKRIAVIGPNADNDLDQLGDWSLGAGQGQGPMQKHPRAATVTMLDGITRRFGAEATVEFAEGCTATGDGAPHKIARAVRIAAAADVAVLVLGDQIPCVGEMKSTATLELTGAQKALYETVLATGTPIVVVLLASKPLAIPFIEKTADAILCAFNPGMEGGNAIAEILAGDFNPSGRLTISFPHHVGQQPVCYNQLPGTHQWAYPDLPAGTHFDPLFAFGFGLSYTTFAHRWPRLLTPVVKKGGSVIAEVEIANTGEWAGIETVQCYLHDLFTSATWPVKNLVDFKRVALHSGERATVRFEIPYDRLAIVDADGNRVVEPGDFELLIGRSSRDADLRKLPFKVEAST